MLQLMLTKQVVRQICCMGIHSFACMVIDNDGTSEHNGIPSLVDTLIPVELDVLIMISILSCSNPPAVAVELHQLWVRNHEIHHEIRCKESCRREWEKERREEVWCMWEHHMILIHNTSAHWQWLSILEFASRYRLRQVNGLQAPCGDF